MYKCENCGGDLRYDIQTGKLKCGYCDQTMTIRSFGTFNSAEESELSVFVCPYCGGEILTNDSTISDFCSYCGSPALLIHQEKRQKMPKRIQPFQVTVKECERKYQDYVSHMPYVPKEYLDEEQKLDFRGIYVPFHSYDVDVNGFIDYKGKNDKASGRSHTVDVYEVHAGVSGVVRGIVHDASGIFSDESSEAITSGERRDEPFHPAYLSGFFADMADVPSDEYKDFALQKVQRNLGKWIEQRVELPKHDRVSLTEKKKELDVTVNTGEDVLRPVWFLSRKAGKRVAYAVVNGRTKDISADLPVDHKKFLIRSLLASVILFFLLELFATITPKRMISYAALFQFILTCVYFSNIGKLYEREVSTEKVPFKERLFYRIAWKTISRRIVFCTLSANVLLMVLVIVDSVGIMFSCGLVFALQLLLLGKYAKKWAAVEKHGTHPTKWMIGSYAASLFLMELARRNPVDDYWYYIGGAVSLAVTILVLFGTIHGYNLICSMPLPQFEAYKGGMQDAG